MTTPPIVFIGSASESTEVGYVARDSLRDVALGILWTDIRPAPNEPFLTPLLGHLEQADYALFVFSADDDVSSRGVLSQMPRDNTLFEAGIAVGTLGRARVFVLYDEDSKPKIPSDLAHLTQFSYSAERSRGDRELAVRMACDRIRLAIKAGGRRQRPEPTRIPTVCAWGDAAKAKNDYADAVLATSESRADLVSEFLSRARDGEVIPTKCLYYTDLGGELWLKICHYEHYRAYRNSLALLKNKQRDITERLRELAGDPEIDLISLGIGDGRKDALLLEELTTYLPAGKYIHYFPVDINQSMLANGMRNAIDNLDSTRVRVKAILSDLTRIHHYKEIYEIRPKRNIFTILGNTLGNNDEKAILEALMKAMLPGDLLLLEVSVIEEEAAAYLSDGLNELIRRHDFSPFVSLGLSFEDENVGLRYVDAREADVAAARSVFENTQSVVGIYTPSDRARARLNLPQVVPMSANHFYDSSSFATAVAHRIRVAPRECWLGGGVGLFLFERAFS